MHRPANLGPHTAFLRHHQINIAGTMRPAVAQERGALIRKLGDNPRDDLPVTEAQLHPPLPQQRQRIP